jgi:hypothetical protein
MVVENYETFFAAIGRNIYVVRCVQSRSYLVPHLYRLMCQEWMSILANHDGTCQS